MGAIGAARQMPTIRSVIALCPGGSQVRYEPHGRCVAGVLFGYAMASGQGVGQQAPVPISGSLAWQASQRGRYAVFSHIGPYKTLHPSWAAAHHDWLASSGESLHDDTPPLEL